MVSVITVPAVEFASSTRINQESLRRLFGTVTLQKPTVLDGPVTLKLICMIEWLKLKPAIVELLNVVT